ncbi:hypothetical protein JAAARDRAFT_136479 [Jaapia argillacea MUCL 33604]|uniref:NADH:flavin oxidoreductase/NADH oxidase N-terminal domain-containing protein n=1 Tax=Jaapia argillacea MUCL 33604 TaxID=933084 RepID=A0A067PG30_9AGAM|nr:hypothetical protein JAAARDRAFT_136479 [Jaapia argillacea MUCL 33604]
MGSVPTEPTLFQPVRVGNITLSHRIVLAPLTRFRANSSHEHTDIAVEYYGQRASLPGSLLITEATFISAKEGLYPNVPGIYTDKQVEAWKKIVEAVHAKGSYIYLQLWALGRAASIEQLEKEGLPDAYASASDVQLSSRAKPPRPLTLDEIRQFIKDYATAASNAVHRAGFDGVEVHCANGYLPDQFMQDVTNKRTDEYGGSVAARSKFALDVIKAVTEVVGEDRVGLRISPWGTFNDMRMSTPEKIVEQFTYFLTTLKTTHPNLSYLHVVEPRATGSETVENPPEGDNNDFVRAVWAPKPLISAGGYTRELALEVAETKGDLVAFGRAYISNPDLPLRIIKDIPWTPPNRSTFYTPEDPKGYVDYEFAKL